MLLLISYSLLYLYAYFLKPFALHYTFSFSSFWRQISIAILAYVESISKFCSEMDNIHANSNRPQFMVM
jgi:hypothetical protein